MKTKIVIALLTYVSMVTFELSTHFFGSLVWHPVVELFDDLIDENESFNGEIEDEGTGKKPILESEEWVNGYKAAYYIAELDAHFGDDVPDVDPEMAVYTEGMSKDYIRGYKEGWIAGRDDGEVVYERLLAEPKSGENDSRELATFNKRESSKNDEVLEKQKEEVKENDSKNEFALAILEAIYANAIDGQQEQFTCDYCGNEFYGRDTWIIIHDKVEELGLSYWSNERFCKKSCAIKYKNM